MRLEVRRSGARLGDIANKVEQLGKRAIADSTRQLNTGGRAMKAGIVPILAAQTGLKSGTIKRFLNELPAVEGRPIYELRGTGGPIRAKFFRPRETASGVQILPRGQPLIIRSSFLMGGRRPNRVALKLGGNVMMRGGKARLKIHVQRTDVNIAEEFVKGRTLEFINSSAARIGVQVIRAFQSDAVL